MKFYVLYDYGFLNKTYAYGEEKDIDFNTGKAEYCKECGRALSMLEWLPPYDVTVSKKCLGDLIFGTYTGFLASERFKNEFLLSGLKGLSEFKRVTLYHKKEKLSKKYYYSKIALINAFVDLNNIDFDTDEESDICSLCQQGSGIINRICGVNFLHPLIIKEDVFFSTVLGQADLFVSEKFKDFIDEGRFTNTKLIEASQYKWDSLNPIEY